MLLLNLQEFKSSRGKLGQLTTCPQRNWETSKAPEQPLSNNVLSEDKANLAMRLSTRMLARGTFPALLCLRSSSTDSLPEMSLSLPLFFRFSSAKAVTKAGGWAVARTAGRVGAGWLGVSRPRQRQ